MSPRTGRAALAQRRVLRRPGPRGGRACARPGNNFLRTYLLTYSLTRECIYVCVPAQDAALAVGLPVMLVHMVLGVINPAGTQGKEQSPLVRAVACASPLKCAAAPTPPSPPTPATPHLRLRLLPLPGPHAPW